MRVLCVLVSFAVFSDVYVCLNIGSSRGRAVY